MPVDDRFVYRAPIWMRSPVVQTSLCRSRIRRWGRNPMLAASREEILVTSAGVRLQGYWSPIDKHLQQGIAILLPGWEGSADSTYMVCTGRTLFKAGYSVYRLNYRDHGHTHHLNEGLFHGALLGEVAEAVGQVAARAGKGPVFVIGFSLGGNFALRLA
ncbi:MAG: alpha/beta fold hydrolase, partial [Candidatus Neomarinimicrobiota bacterium]